MVKAALATLFAGLLVMVATASSSATDATTRLAGSPPKVGFDLRAKGVETRGRARSVGRLQLQRNLRGKRRAVVKGRLNDICPPDGYGAYLQVRVYYPSSTGTRYAYRSAKDIRGCKADAKDVVLKTTWVQNPYKIAIKLHEYDAETGDIARRDAHLIEYHPSQLRG